MTNLSIATEQENVSSVAGAVESTSETSKGTTTKYDCIEEDSQMSGPILEETEQTDASCVEPTPNEPKLTDECPDVNEEREDLREKIISGEEVQLRDFKRVSFKFADMDLSLQRGETKKNVAELVRSLKETKKFYRPVEIFPARKFLEAGKKVYKLDGSELKLSDQDVDLYWVRPDGKQRSIAYAKLFSEKDYTGKEDEYDVRVKLSNVEMDDMDVYVREIQTASPWGEGTKRQAAVAKFGDKESGLTLLNLMITESKMSARAAYKLIYRKEGYKKELYEKSMRDGSVVSALQATPELLERAKKDYESVKIAFRNHPECLKNSAAVDALISVFSSATDPNAAVEDYMCFLQQLQEEDFSSIKAKKSIAEKQNEYESLHEAYKKEKESDTSFMAKVSERITKAREEYDAQKTSTDKAAKTKSKKSAEESYYSA